MENRNLMPLKRLAVSIEEAGAMLNVKRSTAYLMRKRGELPCVRIAGKTLVPIAALEAMMAKLTVEALAEMGRAS